MLRLLQCRRLIPIHLCLVWLAAAPCTATDQTREIAARALLGEAEKLMECALPQNALLIIERVRSEYTGTEAAAFANLRKAQCLYFLRRYDEAITAAELVVTANPGTVLACWAQSILGQSLVDKGQTTAGITELKKVEPMLPDMKDLGPLNEAREAIGRACLSFLSGRNDDLDAVEFLGWSRGSASAKAKVLAILAASRARKGLADQARQTVSRLVTEYPSETVEIKWAKAEVALQEAYAPAAQEAISDLEELVASAPTGDHEASRAALMLARRWLRAGQLVEAVTVLQTAAERYGNSGSGAEILYQFGNALCRQGKYTNGVQVLRRVVDETPRSGFAAPALYCIGTSSVSDDAVRLEALTRLADGAYDARWRGLALWRLGDRYKNSDREKARDCYDRSADIFEERLASQEADLGEDWQEMLRSRITIIRSEIEALDVRR